MDRKSLAGLVIVLALAAAGLAVAFSSPRSASREAGFPPGFFGLGLADAPSASEFRRMRWGGVETARFQLYWPAVEPEEGRYDWELFDRVVADAARAGIAILPVVNGTPAWLAPDPTTLPARGRARSAWTGFLSAAVRRYGPEGTFWRHNRDLPPMPLTDWQVWNEPNFFYFASPVSPGDYAAVVEAASAGITRADPAGRVILAGLFGRPPRPGPEAVPAATFLSRFYRQVDPTAFDAVALHPYAVEAERIEPLIEEVRAVMAENGDADRDLWITEMGWGSGFGSGFEKGVFGQVEELVTAYGLIQRNLRAWRIPAVFWFAWRDAGGCDFCDSTGLTRRDGTFKPAWSAFQSFAAR